MNQKSKSPRAIEGPKYLRPPLALARVPLATAALALALLVSCLPVGAQQNQRGPIADPDDANAPIPDRETFGVKPRQSQPAPDLAQIGVPRTNYPIPAGALFASPQGKAEASGASRAQPTTLAHAVATAPEGGTVVLLGGDYRGVANLKIERRMTLQPAPGEAAWIKGSVLVRGFVPDAGRWSVAWDKKLNHPRAQDLDKANPIAGDTDMVFVNGRSLQQVASLGEVKAGTFFVDTTAKKLILGSDPGGQAVEATTEVTGLEIKGRATWGSVVRGLGFAHFGGQGMEAFSHKLLLENNAFAWNAARGLSLHDADNVVRGNTFACNGLVGMAAVYTDRLLFENNRVLWNNIEGFRATWSAAGTKITISKDMTLRNNLYESNQAAAMWFDISCLRTNAVGNAIRHNKGLGIFYELCHSGTVAFNVLEDNGVALMIADSSSVRAWNNTFLDNAKAVVVKDSPRVNDGQPEGSFYKTKAEDLAAGATWISAANEFRNNLFIGARNDKSVLFDAGPAAKGKGPGSMIAALDYNAYARTAPDRPRLLLRWHCGGKPEDFDSLESFRASSPAHEAHATLLSASPLTGNDYRLAPGSPLLNAGAPWPDDVRALALEAGIALPAQSARIGALGATARRP